MFTIKFKWCVYRYVKLSQIQPKSIELMEGYRVMLTKRQLDCAVDCAGSSPTKLMRNLLSVFFSADILAESSVLGKKGRAPLDRDTLDACIRKSDLCNYMYISVLHSLDYS